MTLNEKMAEAIESNMKWDSEDYAIAANECETIAEELAKSFLLDFVGKLTINNTTCYIEGDNEDILMHLPATIDKRLILYKQSLVK